MTEIYDVLINMRKSFSFLWDEYDFKFIGLMPRYGYHDYGYFARLENEWCLIAFQSESAYLEDIGIVPKGLSSEDGIFIREWIGLLTGDEWKENYSQHNAENGFKSFAEFSQPYFAEIMELAKTPDLFKERIKELKAAYQTGPITIEMIRAERARLHSLGLDSSLGVAIANLRKGGKHE